MSGPGRNFPGWSRDPPAHRPFIPGGLKIIDPARTNPMNPVIHHNPQQPPHGQVQTGFHPNIKVNIPIGRNPSYPNTNIGSSQSRQGQNVFQNRNHGKGGSSKLNPLAESFKGSLLVVGDQQGEDQNWKSRKVSIQVPAMDSTAEQTVPPSHFSDHGVRMIGPNTGVYQHGNPSRYHQGSILPLPKRQGVPLRGMPSTLDTRRSSRNLPSFTDPAHTRAFVANQRGLPHPSNTRQFRPKYIPQTGFLNSDYVHYLQLGRSAYEERIVFRVHTKSSVSPLIYSGNSTTSGFFATSSVFSRLTPKAYEALFKAQLLDLEEEPGLGEERWLTRPFMRELLVRHILCRRPNVFIDSTQSTRLDQREVEKKVKVVTKQDGYWISTTRSIDWAIYEIARRLTETQLKGKGEKEIRLSVINAQPTLSSMKEGGNPHSIQIGRVRERTIEPNSCLSSHERKILSPIKLEASIQARMKSRESHEVLYWGRIFGENIEEDLVFTAEHLPFKLPAKFWKSSFELNSSTSSLPGWLRRLRWNPATDDWLTALRSLRAKVYPTTKWTDQPIHNLGSTWPPSPVSSYPSTSQYEVASSLKAVTDQKENDETGTGRTGSLRRDTHEQRGGGDMLKQYVEVEDLMS